MTSRIDQRAMTLMREILGEDRVASLSRTEREQIAARVTRDIRQQGEASARTALKDRAQTGKLLDPATQQDRARDAEAKARLASQKAALDRRTQAGALAGQGESGRTDLYAIGATLLTAATISTVLDAGQDDVENDPDAEEDLAAPQDEDDDTLSSPMRLRPPRPSWA